MSATKLSTEEELDFFKKKQRENPPKAKEFKFDKFIKLAQGAFSVLAVAGIAFVVNGAYETNQHNKIAQVENSIKKSQSSVLTSIDKERTTLEQTYVSNKLLWTKYAPYKDIAEILNVSKSIAQKAKENESIFNKGNTALDKDYKAIQKVLAAASSNTDLSVKKEVLLESEDMKTFEQWRTKGANVYVHTGELLSIEKRTKQQLEMLEKAQLEIINTVREKIQSKDYNLGATQTALAEKVSKDLSSQVSELEKIKKELKGTPEAKLLSDKDLTEAKEAMTSFEAEAVAQIAKDKATVESMIANMPKEKPTEQILASTSEPTPTATNNPNSWGVLEYYLLYNWIAGGSSSTPSAMASFNHYKSSKVDTPLQTKLYQKASAQYDIKDSNSHLNKSLAPNPSSKQSFTGLNKVRNLNAKRLEMSTVKQKIEKTRQKAFAARNLRNDAVARKNASHSSSYTYKPSSTSNYRSTYSPSRSSYSYSPSRSYGRR